MIKNTWCCSVYFRDAVCIVFLRVNTHIDLLSSAVFSKDSQQHQWPPESDIRRCFFVVVLPGKTNWPHRKLLPSKEVGGRSLITLIFINNHGLMTTGMWLPLYGSEVELFLITWCIDIISQKTSTWRILFAVTHTHIQLCIVQYVWINH